MRALSRLLPALIFFVAGSLLVVMLGKLGTFGAMEAGVEASERSDRVQVELEPGHRMQSLGLMADWGRERGTPPASIFLRFSEPMVKKGQLDKRIEDLPVQMDPPMALNGWWRDYDLLELLPEDHYRRATRYRLHLESGLESLSGQVVDGSKPLEYESRGLEWLGVAFTEDPVASRVGGSNEGAGSAGEMERVRIELRFDMPLRKKDLARHLTVLDRKEKARTVLGLAEVAGSLGRHWVVDVAKWEKDEARTRVGTRWFMLRLSKGLRPRGFELGLAESMTQSLRISSRRIVLEPGKQRVEELYFREMDAYHDRITMGFARPVRLPLQGQVTLDPALPFQVHNNWRGIQLVGDFPAGKTIEVTLKKGFPGHGRFRLHEEIRRLLVVPDLPSRIEFSSPGRILSAKARPEIEVKVSNLDSCELSVRSLYPNNHVSFAHRENRDHAFGPWKSREVRLSGPRNKRWHERLSLAGLLGDKPFGIHEVQLLVRDKKRGYVRSRIRRILQITDLGVSVRLAKGQVALRVHGLAKGEAVVGAQLRVLTPTNQLLTEGKTDAEGLALLRYAVGPKDRLPYVVEVRKGEDRCVLDLHAFGVELYAQGQAGRAYAGDSLEAWLHTDRGIVRPGETLHLTALVRDAAGKSPLGQKLRLAWKDPRGRVLAQESVECSANGMLLAELVTRPESATGNWTAELSDEDGVIGKTHFRVGAFVPARLEAWVEPLAELRSGQKARIRIHGKWLDGAPAEARRGKLKMRYTRAREIPGWLAGWAVADSEVPNSPGEQEPIPFVLDKEGRVDLAVPILTPRRGQQFLRTIMVADLQDPSGRAVQAWSEAVASPSDFIVAMRLVDKVAGQRAGQKAGQKALIALFDPAGKRLKVGGKVQLSLQSRRWASSYYWRRNRWRWHTKIQREQIQSFELDLVEGQAELDVTSYFATGGDWMVLVAEHEGRRVDLPLTQRPQSPDRLRIQTPLAGVVPGETVRIAVDAPFAGKALVTLEGDGIHALRVVELAKGHSEFGLEIPAGLTQPNLHIVANLTRSQATNTAQAPYWCVGSSPLALIHAQRRSTVRIQAPSHIEPEADVEIAVQAEGATEAVIALVDEGILSITRHQSPDPLGFFLARRNLDSEGMDTGLSLYGKPLFPKEILEGGGAGGGAGARLAGTISGLIRPLALWSGRVTLDAEGRGRARFSVPDYEGRLRIVAIAAGTHKLGASSEPLIVRAPISLRLALPRMLAPGDESRLVVHLRNQSGAAGKLKLELTPKGGAELLAPEALDRVWELAEDEILDLSLPFRAGFASIEGAQGFRVHATLGDLERYVDITTLVRPMSVYIEDRRGIAIRGKQSLAIPGSWKGGGPKLSLRFSTRPDQRLLPILESLVRYPYGCLEQTLSRCWPLLSCKTLLPRLYPDGGAPEVEALVSAGIRRILSMQMASGGFALWQGGREERPYLTVEALDFFLAAERVGFAIPAEARADVLGRVQSYLASGSDVLLRIRAAEVLARADKPVLSYLDYLGRHAKSREASARLALIYAKLEREEEARHWLAKIAEARPAERENHGSYASPVKDLALELRAHLALDPDADRVGVLLSRLGRLALQPKRLNTQEQAQVLRELAALYAFTIPDNVSPRVDLYVGDKKYEIRDEKTLSLDLTGHKMIRFESARLSYGYVTLTGFRSDLEQQAMAGVTVERSLLTAKGLEAKVLEKGEVYEVCIEGKAGPGLRNLCLTDLLPGGLEFDGDTKVRFERATRNGFADFAAIDAREFRDDRLLLFLSKLPDGGFRIRYPVRAVSSGQYQKGLLQIESLYDPEGVLRQKAEGKLRIED